MDIGKEIGTRYIPEPNWTEIVIPVIEPEEQPIPVPNWPVREPVEVPESV